MSDRTASVEGTTWVRLPVVIVGALACTAAGPFLYGTFNIAMWLERNGATNAVWTALAWTSVVRIIALVFALFMIWEAAILADRLRRPATKAAAFLAIAIVGFESVVLMNPTVFWG